MKTFRDTAGREWAITVDVNAIKRVMKAPIEHMGEPLKVNLLALVEPESDLLKKLIEFPPLVCDIAYAMLKPQCDERQVSDEDFGRAMGGDVLEKVLDLILEETVDFFPQGRRKVLQRMLMKSQTFAEKAQALMTARLEAGELDAAIDAALEPELKKFEGQEKALPTTGTGTASPSPESLASTPVQERLAN
jgi:hypothetical protein